ncbi:hypothetical protein DFP72DRAFT_893150 [Ephemerocybe angulata]|uniref:Uncharacterized protein n=1 Tax=Ephemerocybe angulata TaxID=980116 RepID=A0A8H6I229_9AGAR|nr:hypothetical protein DFP72DRAFT_893150 [Tulosesus angulatus]
MSISPYNTLYPPFLIYGKDKDPKPCGLARNSDDGPLYGLGWMVYSPGIGSRTVDYYSTLIKITWPSWRQNQCKPATREACTRLGMMVPELTRVKMDYVFVQIARNRPAMFKYLKRPKNRDFIIRQACIALGLQPDIDITFDPLESDLLWVRWDQGNGFADVRYPCKWVHRYVDPTQDLEDVEAPVEDCGHLEFEDGRSHEGEEEKEKKEEEVGASGSGHGCTAPLPDALVDLVECRTLWKHIFPPRAIS